MTSEVKEHEDGNPEAIAISRHEAKHEPGCCRAGACSRKCTGNYTNKLKNNPGHDAAEGCHGNCRAVVSLLDERQPLPLNQTRLFEGSCLRAGAL